jgi:hypothetical protein
MSYDAMRKLRLLAYQPMVGVIPWPADREICATVNRLLDEAGLTEPIDSSGGYRYVGPNGVELDLLLACIGVCDPFEVPFFLEEHGYISEEEAQSVWASRDERKGSARAKRLVVRTYHECYLKSGLRH